MEQALGVAFRTQRDRRNLFQTMERAATLRNQADVAARWQASADEAQRSAELIASAIDELRRPETPPTDG